jgi:hypothetical protein
LRRHHPHNQLTVKSYTKYKNISADNLGTMERAICGCDQSFAVTIRDLEESLTPQLINKQDTSDCEPFPIRDVDSQCCLNEEKGYFKMFNPNYSCCEQGEVRDAGTCFRPVNL